MNREEGTSEKTWSVEAGRCLPSIEKKATLNLERAEMENAQNSMALA
jgi:hypothetical protein